MAQIITKRKKENCKSRRIRERGEHYAAYKAMCDEDRATAQKISKAFAKLSGEATGRVAKALSVGMPRDAKDEGSCCLPEISLYRAGHRKTLTVTAR